MSNFFEKISQSAYTPTARTLLVTSLVILLAVSLLMIASASTPFALKSGLPPMRFFWMQLLYIGISVVAGLVLYRVPLTFYTRFPILVSAWVVVLFLLILTAIIAEPINGARRWLDLGVFNLQVAEFAKLVMVLVMADYVVRRSAEVRQTMLSAVRLLIWYVPVVLVLLMHPDFGSSVVIMASAGVILFISGVPKRHFFTLIITLLAIMAVALWSSEYRQKRILSFGDPFDDTLGTDFQLSRSLVAYARGGIDGVGYGNSVLKLSHLPESHTDFLMAITGEELGLMGVCFVLLLQACIIGAIMKISYTCLKRRQLRLSYIVFGFGAVIFGQTVINTAMTLGLLPTKGLTFPFYSFGGSSMLVSMLMIVVILKVDKESIVIFEKNKNRDY